MSNSIELSINQLKIGWLDWTGFPWVLGMEIFMMFMFTDFMTSSVARKSRQSFPIDFGSKFPKFKATVFDIQSE